MIVAEFGKGMGEVGGEKPTDGFSVSEEDGLLTFENVASVDVIIRNLEELKNMMNREIFDGLVDIAYR